MHLISGNNVSDVVLQAYNLILNEGHYRPSRNGGCTSVFDTTLEITNPRSRHLSLEGRKSNIFAMIAETFWILSGDDRVNPYLSFFLPRAPDYSDDGKTWHGAYGPRMYEYNQLEDALNVFITDGKHTRRSFVTISDPVLDNQSTIELYYGDGHKAKDIPCNREIMFYVEGENEFCCKVIQRSGDIIFGTGSINPFEFSFIHELMYGEVKKHYPEIKLGSYRWHCTNTHLYDFSKKQAEDATEEVDNYLVGNIDNNMPLIGPDISQWKEFFSELVDLYTQDILTDEETDYNDTIEALEETFDEYKVPTGNNILWVYCLLVAHYIANKKGSQIDTNVVDLSNCDDEFKRAIIDSSFRKFAVVE